MNDYKTNDVYRFKDMMHIFNIYIFRIDFVLCNMDIKIGFKTVCFGEYA